MEGGDDSVVADLPEALPIVTEPEKKGHAVLLSKLGEGLQGQKKYALARRCFLRAWEIDPLNWEILKQLATCCSYSIHECPPELSIYCNKMILSK
jgi:hypothetical protein